MSDDGVPTIDELYWRAYATAVKRVLAPGPLGDDIAVFIAPQTQRGIAAGKFIPDVVTNDLTYNVADNLLPGTSPLYVPGGAARYTQQLVSYLNWVKVNNNPSPGALQRLTDALNNLNLTQTKLETEQDKAFARFAKYPDKSVTFEQWCRQFGQTYLRAIDTNKAAAGNYDQALMEYWGPDAGQLITYKDGVKLAQNTLSGVGGYNMSCTLSDLNLINDLWKQSNGGSAPAPPDKDKLFYLPAFAVQGLGPSVDNWITMFGKEPTTISVDLDVGRNTSWEELGFQSVETSASLGYWFIFSITVTVEHETRTRHLELSEDEQQVQFELTCNGLASFPIQPGAWDVPGVKTLFPNLRDGAPDGLLDSLIRAESLLIGYGVGCNVSFSGSVRDEVDDMISEVTSASGSAKLFGWDIDFGAGGSYNSSRIVTSSDVSWDKESGSLVIPSVDNGYPTLLGVLGRRL